MKQEEKYQPLSLNHKGCIYMPSEEVRSAVMGLARSIGREVHNGEELVKAWFPVCFKEDESGVQE